MDCCTLYRRPDYWSHKQHLRVIADATVLAAESAASRAAWREVLATVLPSSRMAMDSCTDSCGRQSLNLDNDSHRLKSYILSRAC